MLWCETGGSEPRDFEELAVCVSQINGLGVAAGVHVRSVRADLPRTTQFDLAPFVFDEVMAPDDRVALLAADRLDDTKLLELRRLASSEPRSCLAFGSFGSRRAALAANAKLSYVFGGDPTLVDLATELPLGFAATHGCPVFGVPRRPPASKRPRVLVIGPVLKDDHDASALLSLALSSRFDVTVLTDGKTRRDWIAAHRPALPMYQYSEALPMMLTGCFDICAVFNSLKKNYRLQCLVANLVVSGATLLDCTEQQSIARKSDAFIRGPRDLLWLSSFLTAEILPNAGAIAEHVRRSATASRLGAEAVAALRPAGWTEAPLPVAVDVAPPRPPQPLRAKIVFMPTNGVGLGHAQRCTLIAGALDAARVRPAFAASPSCIGLIKSHGFDAMPLVMRSAAHSQSHENDLVNYLRLRALSVDASVLVFDGAYVFDSVYRTILDNRLRGVWIRRGLWHEGTKSALVVDREKTFERVIVPTEAFDELNASYSWGDHVHAVGPIVQRVRLDETQRGALRAQLAERYGRDFDQLVVTQLGAGVVADRGAQIQAICGMMERRGNVLHLVVVWPNATIHPLWFAWSRTKVVRTHHAAVLTVAADLCISAAGYNSVYQLVYDSVPTIFLPQTGTAIDDQMARARAARDRGLAGLVEPHMLMTLERHAGRVLDDPGSARHALDAGIRELPEPGNARAAALIEELIHEPATVDRHPVADSSAGRR